MDHLAQRLRFARAFHADPGWRDLLNLPETVLQVVGAAPKPRTSARLASALIQQLDLPVIDRHTRLPEALLGLSKPQIDIVIALAGSTWHGQRLRNIIEGSVRTELTRLLGLDAIRFALEHIHLAQAADQDVDVRILAEVIRQDGLRCWQSWLSSLEPAVRVRAALMLPPKFATLKVWPSNHQRRVAGEIVVKALQAIEVSS